MYTCSRNPRNPCSSFGLHAAVATEKLYHVFVLTIQHEFSMFVIRTIPSVGTNPCAVT